MNPLRPSSSASLLQLRRLISTSSVRLSGHNKWSKIKEKKGVNDRKKGQVYSKATRDIAIAVRSGGSADPDLNAALAAVLKRVKQQGVPKDNIETALKKAAGAKDRSDQQFLVYEAMAPGSVGMIIECITDNVNRTKHAVDNLLSGHGARMAPVKFLFSRLGCIEVALDKAPESEFERKLDRLIETMLDAGAEDFKETAASDVDVELEFTCQPQDLGKITTTALETGLCRELLNSELQYRALEETPSLDEHSAERIDGLLEEFDELDDVLKVWTTLGASG
ncbi:DUF28-domain-containing protein [Laetiporus sulphureus 93-53]|uniref:DUF28-domain-containing protein n=1 Tax=Laetiporus sulphureus 93-53 TaxID=1314785 RepID=A0A165HBJ4_9APHY|nr:DUF28-domain-containing protein [Laetiporus sulphureus 93-53]KZT11508.1 DUF28-domain-containing protein [Laetiporus sulphureus 93-53]